jgi:Putative MetA-pathway of phenol degradation
MGGELGHGSDTRRALAAIEAMLGLALALCCPVAEAADYRQSREDAWWTGPILAAGASTLPPGHALIEPYVFNVMSRGRYDDNGTRHDGPRRESYGSLTYLLFGVVDGFTAGVIPRFGYNDVSNGADSSHIGVGDCTLQGTFRLAQFREGGYTPTMSIVLQEVLPTGKYDRLGARPSEGLGSGAHTTSLGLNSQYFLWMPNGRILRTRLNLSYAISDAASVEDVSVYGTSAGFRGHARPGRVFIVDSAWEYSLTRNWVLALDVQYEHDGATTLQGFMPAPSGSNAPSTRIQQDFGSGEVFTLAPAVEYNFNSRIGVIVGSLFTVAGRNASATVVPVAALNMVF